MNLSGAVKVKQSLLGCSRSNLISELSLNASQKFRADQILVALYRHGINCSSSSSPSWRILPANLRKDIGERYSFRAGTVLEEQTSIDGTKKWLIRLEPTLGSGGKLRRAGSIETVYIPEPELGGKGTLCVSSQIGCALNCAFCKTGTQPFGANLLASDILEQVIVAQEKIGGGFPLSNRRGLTNIVFMGQGEPLLNFENVSEAIQVITAELQFSKHKIMVSTSGVAPKISLLGNLGVRLAVSLHAANDTLRDVLVPINKKYPLSILKESLVDYVKRRSAVTKNAKPQRISFEYVMLEDVNDTAACAKDLAGFLRQFGSLAHVNLIPFNPWPGSAFSTSPEAKIRVFRQRLITLIPKLVVTTRTQRGSDISAACGQLKT